MAFRPTDGVGTRFKFSIAAQWLAYILPCRRFADILANACARLGADADRYSFIAVDLHHLLFAGLPAHLSEKLIRSHWENNYGGSVKALAVVKKQLADALANKDTPPYVYNDLKREHLMRTGSVVLHELYFDNLGGDGNPDATVRAALADAFGSHDTWESEFRRMGLGLGGGSGWVMLGYNLHPGQIENYWLWDHLHGPPATLPLLVMDMYEHSYQMDFGAATAKYVDAFFQNIRWEAVLARLEQAKMFARG